MLVITCVLFSGTPTENFFGNIVASGESVLENIENTDFGNTVGDDEGQLLYSIGVLSDLHLNVSSNDKYTDKSEAKFKNALQFLNEYGCDYTFISGDITDNGTNSEFAKYVEIRDQYKGDMQVFASTGNHEASSSKTYSNKITESNCIAYNIYNKIGNHYFYYIENGKYTYWDLSEGHYTTDSAETITIEDPSIILPENDVYIFLSILGDANNGAFWNESLQWIYETFEKNKDKRCFVFEHNRAEYAEDIVNGVMTNDIYSSYVSGNQTGLYLKPMWRHGNVFPTTHTLESLFAHYTNIVWFHGHSHHSADTSKYVGYPGYSVGNVDSHFGNAYESSNPSASANNTKWTWSVHVPSVVEIREVVDGALYRNKNYSEGLIVDVYKNKIVLKYITFTNDKGATFINEVISNSVESLDTTLDQIGEYVPPTVMVGNTKTTIIEPKRKNDSSNDSEATVTMLGDCNGDRNVDTTDLAIMKLFLTAIGDLSDIGKLGADLNGDRNVDATDLAMLKLKLVGIE